MPWADSDAGRGGHGQSEGTGQSTGADTGRGACALGGRLRPYWSHQSWAPGPAISLLPSTSTGNFAKFRALRAPRKFRTRLVQAGAGRAARVLCC